jgi:acetyl esterase/lipase
MPEENKIKGGRLPDRLPVLYRQADLPAERIVHDLRYWDGPDADPEKNLRDLYRPKGTGWPVLVFIHGGGWTNGASGTAIRPTAGCARPHRCGSSARTRHPGW